MVPNFISNNQTVIGVLAMSGIGLFLVSVVLAIPVFGIRLLINDIQALQMLWQSKK